MAQGSTIALKQRTREARLWLGMERRSASTSNPKDGVHGGLAGRTAAWAAEDGLVVKRRSLAVVKLEESREAKTGAEKTRGTQRPLGPAQPRRPGLQHQESTGSGLGLLRLLYLCPMKVHVPEMIPSSQTSIPAVGAAPKSLSCPRPSSSFLEGGELKSLHLQL